MYNIFPVQNLDGWKLRRRKQSEDAIERLTEMKRFGDDTGENGNRKSWVEIIIKPQSRLWISNFYDGLANEQWGDNIKI